MKEKSKLRITIRRKFLIFVSILIFVGLGAGITLGYYWGFRLIRDTVASSQREYALIFSGHISDMLDEHIHQVRVNSTSLVWREAIISSNLKYANMAKEEAANYLLDMDKKWIAASDESGLIKDYIENKAGLSARAIIEQDTDIAEIIIADKYGGLVAASGRSSDFYQADEEWWQEAFYGDKISVNNISFDESAGVLALSISCPIKDKANELIGVSKTIVDINNLFSPLENFKVGKTGHVVLVDEKNYIIFHKGVEPLSEKYISDEDMAILKKSGRCWGIIEVEHEKETVLTSYEPINMPLLLEKGMRWNVFIAQDADEVFAPSYSFLRQAVILVALLLIILFPLTYILGIKFTKPIEYLHKSVQNITEGKFNQEIEVKTNDEVGDLAISINQMVSTMNSHQSEILKAKGELEKLYGELEEKVKERTAELSRSQAATLNIMEDLQDAYQKIKEAQDQLVQAGKMQAVGLLASGVAHEVKNPLGIILQGVNFLEKRIPQEQQDSYKILAMVKDSVIRADNIIRGILDFSRSSELNLQPEDINQVLDSSLELSKQALKDKQNIEFVIEAQKNLLKVAVDKNKMQQVFINLIVNAAHALPQGGKIILRTYSSKMENIKPGVGRRSTDYFKPDEGTVIVEIEDTGMGISAEALQKIFDPFFTTKGPREGAGLGLAICRNIIDMHKGFIEVKSQVGKGTKFIITLKTAGGGVIKNV